MKAVDVELAEEISQFYADPAGFVRFAFPWGEPGSALEQYAGPDGWQTEYLERLGELVRERAFDGRTAVQPVRMSRSSGHGIGKSTMAAWLVCWIMSTRPRCRGTVTANTFTQLSSKTWASVQRWSKLCITGHWFICTGDRLYQRDARESWFTSAQTCREENSEAFAGQHAADSTSFYLFDEASAVPDKIYEVAEGGLTDGEPMEFLFGNPTRNSGKFHRSVFGSERNRWDHGCIDSRESGITNKEQIAQWLADYGEDSDFFRVRVRGLAPRAADAQYIDSDRVYAAQNRLVAILPDEPLVAGLDVARGGGDNCVIRFRRGLDAAGISPIRIPGADARDSTRVITIAADVLTRDYSGQRVAMLFVDETGVGGPIGDRLRQLGHRNVTGVQFAGGSPDSHYANMRAWMWSRLRDWLERGRIDRDERLATDLTGPGYFHNKRDQLLLESKEDMKKRGLDSPDDGDALALTFAAPVGPPRPKAPPRSASPAGPWS